MIFIIENVSLLHALFNVMVVLKKYHFGNVLNDWLTCLKDFFNISLQCSFFFNLKHSHFFLLLTYLFNMINIFKSEKNSERNN